MTTFIGVLTALTVWAFITIGALAWLTAWAQRRRIKAQQHDSAGKWEYVCDCERCAVAPQPDTTVTPTAREYGHDIPRDSFCHDRTADCACGPDLGWSVAGPYLMHRASKALVA